MKFTRWQRIILWICTILLVLVLIGLLLIRKPIPPKITYGISFNTPYALELGLDPKEVFVAFLDELGIRHFRLAAHWDLVEPTDDQFDFSHIDFQLEEAEKRGADVVFAVGRRLPRWPECHTPSWTENLSWEEQKEELREYITEVVTRYKDQPNITYWQVENEPYLTVFAHEHCGDLDEAFLKEEIELVRSLDGTRNILVTDSGNLGTWHGAYRNGDAFGTSVYVYFWNPELGQFKTVLPPAFYRAKENFMELLYGKKPTFLIELSVEPWLLAPVTDVPFDVQYSRMDLDKFNEIIEYAKETRYDQQYLWGGEWWYWLKSNGSSGMWERARTLFQEGT